MDCDGALEEAVRVGGRTLRALAYAAASEEQEGEDAEDHDNRHDDEQGGAAGEFSARAVGLGHVWLDADGRSVGWVLLSDLRGNS